MDVIRATVALRDRALLDVFDLAIRFVARHAKKLSLAALVGSAPGLVIVLAMREDFEAFAIWPIALFFVVVGELPVVALASRLVFDDRATVREGIVLGLRGLFRVLGTRLVQAIAIALTSFTIFLPVWAQGMLLFAPDAALLERASSLGACSRSQRLANRSTGESILGALLLGLAQILSAPVGDWIGRTTMTQLFDTTPPAPIWDDGASIFALVGFFVAGPILALVRFFLYLNVRTRVEGWDVQTRFAAIAQRHALSRRPEAA